MTFPIRVTALALLLATTSPLGFAVAAHAQIQKETAPQINRRFDIPSQPLASALTRFGDQADMQVTVDTALVARLKSRAVSGQLAPEAALTRLLAGTGLVWRHAGPRAVVLEKAPSSTGALSLGTIRVEGANGGGTTGIAGTYAEDEAPEGRADRVYSRPSSTAEIQRETLERFRGTSVGDMIKGVAGVTAGDPRSANALDVNIRGIQGQSRIPVIIDGTQSGLDTYRGYAGQAQRSYLDPDLISSVTITKGPSLEANASGAIGGTVSMDTLKPADILREGKTQGLRIRTGVSDASTKDLPPYDGFQSEDRNDITDPGSWFFNIAAARTGERFDVVAAYARRENGNYFAGKDGYDRFPQTARTVAPLNPANAEVFNTSSDSESILLKGTWRIDDFQTLEAGYRRYDGEQGEIMASQILRVNRQRVPQWEPGQIKLDSYNLRYRYRPQNDLIDLKANLWLTRAESLMYNGLTGVTPWFIAHHTEWFDGPTFNTEEGYRAAYWNELSIEKTGGDVTNTSRLFTDAGQFDFTYGASFTNEDIRPGPNSPILFEDLINNRYLKNARRHEYSLIGAVKWLPTEKIELELGVRYNHVKIVDRNRDADVLTEAVIGRYRDTQLRGPNPANPNALINIQRVYWYPDAQGNFTEASLRASAYERGIVGDITGWTTYTAGAAQNLVAATSWTWTTPIQRTHDAVMPSLSASYRFDNGVLVYAKYAEGVKLPSLFESTLGLFTAAKPTDDLRPERNKSWELGVSGLRRDLFRTGDRASLKIAYFDTRIKDLITRDYRSISAGLIRNVDSFNVTGIELQGGYDTGKLFAELSAHHYFKAETCAPDIAAERRQYGKDRKIADLLNTPDCAEGGFEGSYTNTQNPPKYNVNLTLGARLFDKRLTVGTRAVYNSGPISKLDQEWNVGLSAIQQLYHQATIIDAFTSYKLNDQMAVDLNIDNLTDEYYLDPLSLAVVPAPGRTVRLALTYRY
ncbi:Vitamin B12 transporter BtuB (plasmid) [Asticcacaulis sp. MM231]|uniref:TonB-dependent receptor n=1 Tax=Asticcacaulis sp. MM231 TaxID=3157666 RepID=UPI0032D57886